MQRIINRELDKQMEISTNLREQLHDTKEQIKMLEAKISDLKKSLEESRENNKKLQNEKQELKTYAQQLQDDLTQEKKRPWWRNASDLAKVPLSVLQNAAVVMLPVLSNQMARSTSTSDIDK